jgi:diguanylate cyclase (GGDEF)-like protein
MLEALSTDAMTAVHQAQGIGTKLLDGLGAAYAIGNEEINSTPSIGICLFSGQQTAIDELMRRADQAMYQAKAAGRNTIRLADNKV